MEYGEAEAKSYEEYKGDEGDVVRQVERLSNIVERLAKTYSIIHDQLIPITHDTAPSDGQETTIEDRDALVPLAARINKFNEELDHIVRRFNELSNRISL